MGEIRLLANVTIDVIMNVVIEVKILLFIRVFIVCNYLSLANDKSKR